MFKKKTNQAIHANQLHAELMLFVTNVAMLAHVLVYLNIMAIHTLNVVPNVH